MNDTGHEGLPIPPGTATDGSPGSAASEPELLSYQPLLGIPAFSTTRHGGYSTGAYGQMNINAYCGDTPRHISQNLHLLAGRLGLPDGRIIIPHQVHATEPLIIDAGFFSLTPEERQQKLEGKDMVLTRERNVCVGVSTADCVPILLYDSRHQAIAAVHAGWRGTLQRAAERAVREMGIRFGSNASELQAVIGPSISLEHFEVGNEVYDAFAAARFNMSAIARHTNKWHIDLASCNRLQLQGMGLAPANILCTGICTYSHTDRFFSARRLGSRSGRIYSGLFMPA